MGSSVTTRRKSWEKSRNFGVISEIQRAKFVGRLQRVTCPVCNSSHNFVLGCNVAQNQLVLHHAIFLENCLATLEKDISCKLQKTCYTLQSRAASCNELKKFHAIKSLQKGEPSSIQGAPLCAIVATPNQLRDKLQRGQRGHMLQAATYLQLFSQQKLQTKLQRVNTSCRVPFYSCNHCSDLFQNHCKLQPETAICNMSTAIYNGLQDKLQGKTALPFLRYSAKTLREPLSPPQSK